MTVGIKPGKCSICGDILRNLCSHKGLIRGMCQHCYNTRYVFAKRANWSPEEKRVFNEHCAKRSRDEKWSFKLKVFAAYGGKCECCGETDPRFLCIDHIFGGGCVDRRMNRNFGYKLLVRLRDSGYPKDKYRLLCFNCNTAVHRLGYCPHRTIDDPCAVRKGVPNVK